MFASEPLEKRSKHLNVFHQDLDSPVPTHRLPPPRRCPVLQVLLLAQADTQANNAPPWEQTGRFLPGTLKGQKSPDDAAGNPAFGGGGGGGGGGGVSADPGAPVLGAPGFASEAAPAWAEGPGGWALRGTWARVLGQVDGDLDKPTLNQPLSRAPMSKEMSPELEWALGQATVDWAPGPPLLHALGSGEQNIGKHQKSIDTAPALPPLTRRRRAQPVQQTQADPIF